MKFKTTVRLLGCAMALMSFAPAQSQINSPRGGTGPHAAVVESDRGLKTHTVYRPLNLDVFGPSQRLPIVSWGNGGCVNIGDASRDFLREIASHGFVVIAVGPIGGVRPAAAPRAADGPPRNAPATRAEQLTEAVDWAIAEHSRADSHFAGKLDTDAIALMGYSCGGLQAMAQSQDERIKTLVLWNSGILPPGDRRPGMEVSKAMLAGLSLPVAYFAGGPADIAYGNAVDDVSRIERVPLFFGNIDVGHGGTYAERDGGAYAQVAAAWLKWQLKGDMQAARMFVGADCGLCQDPAWTVAKKNID
jgi:hypothetical protein